MNQVEAKVIWKGSMRFAGANGQNGETIIDGNREVGPTPLELLLQALVSCASTDVVNILQKMQQPLERFEISASGERHSPEPRYLVGVRVRFDLWGQGLDPAKVERSIGLSLSKYCSVYHSLRPDINFEVLYRIRDHEEAAGEYRPLLLEATSA